MKNTIAILPGDGIGPEVMTQTLRVLSAIEKKYNHKFCLFHGEIGGSAYEKYENHFPKETKEICLKSNAILFGSVGGPIEEAHLPKWQNCEKNSILSIRKTFSLNSNIRPAKVYPELSALCPLKKEVIGNGIDMVIIRELLGDIYFGEHKTFTQNNVRYARDISEYNENQIKAVAHTGFKLARLRKQKVTSVDKANVLDTSKLWRTVVSEVAMSYPDVHLEHMLVDNCAMQLFINPRQFDVIVTANLFGDILSDAAAALPGSLGLMPSASLNESQFGLYEPAGGSAPSLAGKNIANPIAQILSLAMMLRYTFEYEAEAIAIEHAIEKTLKNFHFTRDLCSANENALSTSEITDKILEFI